MEIAADPSSARWHPVLAVLKISKVTFWFIWLTPYVFGYVASADRDGASHLAWFLFAALGVCSIESANCIHNELVDQEEDRINQPNRASLIASVGESRLWKLAIVGYVGSLAGIVLVGIVVDPLVALLMFLAAAAAPLYNWGPRLKRRPGLAEVGIAWATLMGYLAGWRFNASLGDVSAVVWVVVYFFGITSLMKDLPDVAGDEKVQAPGIFSIRWRTLRTSILAYIYLSPYALLVALVGTGVLPVRMLGVLAVAVMGIAVMVLGERARSLPTFIAAYELAFFYVHVFMLVLFVLYTPTRWALLAAAVLFVGRGVALTFQLAPRFVEPSFSWSRSLAQLVHAR
jgi:4-hydroxybenzoate polyprenyltransferase